MKNNNLLITTGMKTNWQKNPIAGPTGFFNVLRQRSQSIAHPKLIYSIETSIATLAVNIMSITRSCRVTITSMILELTAT